jgi:small-conductance mechanosensitive channel
LALALLTGLAVVEPALFLTPVGAGIFDRALTIAITVVVSWALVRIALLCETLLSEHIGRSSTNDLQARKAQTQIGFARKLVVALIVCIATVVILMGFPHVRRLGTSLLASAGLAGLIVGIAAQRSMGNLFAGLQVAFTQPVRIGDAVVVEGEWGTVDEIALTYVVVKLWDLRNLVLPINYFIEKPFQNWTRNSTNLLGTVYLFVDFCAPLAKMREQLRTIVGASPLWDGRVASLQVTDSTESALQVRALVSSRNAGELWDLRCAVREGLVDFLREQHEAALPRRRTTLSR